MNKLKKSKTNHLAEGEFTGHFHQAIGDGVVVMEENELSDFKVLHAPNGATITHQEHNPIVVPAEVYKKETVNEYDYDAEMARKVRD